MDKPEKRVQIWRFRERERCAQVPQTKQPEEKCQLESANENEIITSESNQGARMLLDSNWQTTSVGGPWRINEFPKSLRGDIFVISIKHDMTKIVGKERSLT